METLYKEAGTAVAVRTAGQNTSKFITLVEEAYLSDNRSIGYDGTVASLVWSGFSKMSKIKNTWKRATFKSLLIHLHKEGAYIVLRNHVYIDVLINISIFGLKMIRPIESWSRPSFSPDEQIEDLIDHLFAKYATPVFLITTFYESSLSRMLWYIKLSQGASVKELPNFPEYLTAKMVHYFKETPKGYSVSQALIRAQALGYGATEIVANRFAYSQLIEKERDELFWNEVILFFAKATEEDLRDFAIILNYLEFTRARNRSFSLKGRTFTTITRDAIAWNVYTAKINAKASQVEWYPSGIKALNKHKVQGDNKVTYVSIELLNANDLYEEGQEMNHCVGDYVDDCIAGDSAIFSLQKIENGTFKRLATVEVNPRSWELVEANGNCNSELTHEAFSILKTWLSEADVKGWWDYKEQKAVHTPQRVGGGNPPEEIDSWTFTNTVLRWIIWFLVFQCLKACLF